MSRASPRPAGAQPGPPDPPDRRRDPPECPPSPLTRPGPPGPRLSLPILGRAPGPSRTSSEPFVPPESAADAEATDASRLLVQAVGQLPAADRDRVYAWLLRTGFRPSPAGVPGPLARRLGWSSAARQAGSRRRPGSGAPAVVAELVRGSSSPAQQMVPVRFSADQHARLRAWCTRARVLDGDRDPRPGGPVPGKPAARARLARGCPARPARSGRARRGPGRAEPAASRAG